MGSVKEWEMWLQIVCHPIILDHQYWVVNKMSKLILEINNLTSFLRIIRKILEIKTKAPLWNRITLAPKMILLWLKLSKIEIRDLVQTKNIDRLSQMISLLKEWDNNEMLTKMQEVNREIMLKKTIMREQLLQWLNRNKNCWDKERSTSEIVPSRISHRWTSSPKCQVKKKMISKIALNQMVCLKD